MCRACHHQPLPTPPGPALTGIPRAALMKTPLRNRPHLASGHLTIAQATLSAWRAHTPYPDSHTHTYTPPVSKPGQLLVNLKACREHRFFVHNSPSPTCGVPLCHSAAARLQPSMRALVTSVSRMTTSMSRPEGPCKKALGLSMPETH